MDYDGIEDFAARHSVERLAGFNVWLVRSDERSYWMALSDDSEKEEFLSFFSDNEIFFFLTTIKKCMIN